MQLRLVDITLLAVAHDNYQGEYDGNVTEQWYIGDKLESLQPADWDKYERSQEDVNVFIIAIVLLSLNAYNLVQLFSNKYQIGNTKTKLRNCDAEIDEIFAPWTENCKAQLWIRLDMHADF